MQTLANDLGTDAGKAGRVQPAVKLIEITGTAPGRWRQMADALVSDLAARGLQARVTDIAEARKGGAAAGTLSLGFIDLPEHALAGELPEGFGIEAWEHSARALLAAVQAQPATWRLIDTDEVAREPESLARQVTAWTGAAGVGTNAPAPAAKDPLAAWLVRSLAPLRQLRDELYASTTALTEAEPNAAQQPWTTTVSQYLQMRRAEVAGREQLAALQRKVAESEQALAHMTLQLHQAQEELEARHLRNAATSEQADGELAECRRERDLLLIQLHQVQEELELQFLEWQAADSGLPATGHAAPTAASARLRVLHSAAGTPHRHVDIAVDGLRIGERLCEDYTLRFVEHLGHPGLLFWHPSGRSVGLTAWEANGQEADRDFMLVIPGSAGGRDFLARLGTQDWLFVNDLARAFKTAAAAMPELAAWQAAAARLVRELDALPARLRYDRLVVADASADGAVGIALEQARFGAQPLGTVRLTWHQASRRLVWAAPTDVGEVPLVSWPVTANGELAAEYELPVGGAAEIPDGRERWGKLGPADKDLILAVLDALPGAASAASGGTALTLSAASLERDARELHRQARRLESRRRLNSLLKRLLPFR